VGTLCPTFSDACVALGLLGDDREWEQAMTDADVWATPKELCRLFVSMLIFCDVSYPNKFGSSQHADVRHNTCTVQGLRLNPAFEKEI
jgi:hypothetical protein